MRLPRVLVAFACWQMAVPDMMVVPDWFLTARVYVSPTRSTSVMLLTVGTR